MTMLAPAPVDDRELRAALSVVDHTLSRPEQMALLRSALVAAHTYGQRGDLSGLTAFAEEVVTAVRVGGLRQHAESLAESEHDQAAVRLFERYGA